MPTTHPSKEQVRDWLRLRRTLAYPAPPPSPEQIRRELGWDLIRAEQDAMARALAAL
jgi:hypothetical protein